MLEPLNRRLLLDALRPPEGHRLDFALGTTYSLDLVALLAAPMAFAFSDWQDSEGRLNLDPLRLLKAVREYADKICLFCQAGRIAVPTAYNRLLLNLENSVVEVNAPLEGNFHPKLWFLRYVADNEAVIYRFLCLSRNMTFDPSWDTMLCLEGPLRDRVNAFAQNHPLGDFVSALPGMKASGKFSPVWQKRIDLLARELRKVEFKVPEPFSDYAFWPMGVSEKSAWPFPDRMDRVLVVSPFVDDGFLEDLAGHEAPMSLVSRSDSLAQLTPESIRRFENVRILDERADPEPGEQEEPPGGEEISVDTVNGVEKVSPREIPLTGLHAKLYVADVGWSAHVWTGSTNATKAGFTRNVEFLVKLKGKRKDCGTEATVNGLIDLLQPFEYNPTGNEPDGEEKKFQWIADQLAKALAVAAPVAHCETTSEADAFAIRLTATRKTNLTVPDGCGLRAWPISLPKGWARPVDLGRESWVTFDSVSVDNLTAFFAFELFSKDKGFCQTFALNIPLQGAPDNRQDRLLRQLLKDPDGVRRFLLLLLTDRGAEAIDQWFRPSSSTEGKKGAMRSLFEPSLLESLLRALDRDPEQIDQVVQLLRDLDRTPEGKELLPPGVKSILEPIELVRKLQRGE
ncbi:MAG: phospholipase D family protein [Gemmataceae bacterium]